DARSLLCPEREWTLCVPRRRRRDVAIRVLNQSCPNTRLGSAEWCASFRSGRDRQAVQAPRSASACLFSVRRFFGRVPQLFSGIADVPGQAPVSVGQRMVEPSDYIGCALTL